jgi:hypothetical protein
MDRAVFKLASRLTQAAKDASCDEGLRAFLRQLKLECASAAAAALNDSG